MGDRPTLAGDIYTRYVREDNEITWPQDGQERVRLARALYGKQLIGTFDYWFSHALDLIENAEPAKPFPRKNEAYKKDAYFRNRLSTLSAEQKQVVRHLIRTTAYGVLFGVLVDIDQSDYGEFTLALKPGAVAGNGQTIQLAPDEENDLHDELRDWILSFSRYADEITELVEIKGGWQLQDKEFYKL